MAPEKIWLDLRPLCDSDTVTQNTSTETELDSLLLHFLSAPTLQRWRFPTELVDSKNKKKMETARSDTTLTDRSGCLERTFDATSCTQMERDIRWAILRSKVTNSISPEGGSGLAFPSFAPFPSLVEGELGSTFTMPARYLTHSLRMAMNVDGTAESSTESASTMPISSSSERCASWAASSSSLAMPNETENARSDPREPSAPAVAMLSRSQEPPVRQSCVSDARYSLTSSDVRSASREACVLDAVIAKQKGLTLVVRRLLISPAVGTKHSGRGGKALRERVGSTHRHTYSGNVYGCLLGSVLDFVRGPNDRVSDIVRTLRNCLQPVSKDLMTCDGDDTRHLLCGFASHHAIRGQLQYIPEFKGSSRIDSRYGKKNVVLGISACVYFVLTALSQCADHSMAISMVTSVWVHRCLNMLSHWSNGTKAYGPFQSVELQAEYRALERGKAAASHARRYGKELGLDTYNSVRLELAYMRKAMWPAGRRLDYDSQAELLSWIESDQFRRDVDVPNHARPRMNITVNVPLSAIPMLDSQRGDSDGGSSCDSASSCGSSLLSASSAASDAHDHESIAALSSLFDSVPGTVQ